MKIALAQMRVLPGEPEKNFRKMTQNVAQAKQQGCTLIAFPEMCVGGYLLGDRWTEDAWCGYLASFNKEVAKLSNEIAILWGNVYLDGTLRNKDGRSRKYNAGFAFYNNQPIPRSGKQPPGLAIKTLLPNYRMFDDERYFFSLQEYAESLGEPLEALLQPFELHVNGEQFSFGLEICEDLWFNDYTYQKRPLNVSRFLIENGSECIFNLSSSPWTYGKNRARHNRIRDSHNDTGHFVPFYYVNCVSVQNNGKNFVLFDGDTTIYDANAEVAAEVSEPFLEDLLFWETKANNSPAKYVQRPELDAIEAKYRGILEGLKGLDELMGNRFPYVIGLSGGVDSSLVACLLVEAAGKDRVVGLNLPSRYNSSQTRSIASKIAAKLGIRFEEIPIEGMVEANEKALKNFPLSELNRENIQAKIRGTSVLSNVAAALGGVMTNNGNKVEIALGYATLYGDINGAIAPIGDLLKTEVFSLCKFMNEKIYKEEVIPNDLLPDEGFDFKLPPTAELKDKQVDPMKWGYHDALTAYFTDFRKGNAGQLATWYAEGSLCHILKVSPEVFDRYGLNDPETFFADLEWFVNMMQRAVFKRIQAPPIIILSKSAFGFDIRESQVKPYFTHIYHETKKAVLDKKEGKRK